MDHRSPQAKTPQHPSPAGGRSHGLVLPWPFVQPPLLTRPRAFGAAGRSQGARAWTCRPVRASSSPPPSFSSSEARPSRSWCPAPWARGRARPSRQRPTSRRGACPRQDGRAGRRREPPAGRVRFGGRGAHGPGRCDVTGRAARFGVGPPGGWARMAAPRSGPAPRRTCAMSTRPARPSGWANGSCGSPRRRRGPRAPPALRPGAPRGRRAAPRGRRPGAKRARTARPSPGRSRSRAGAASCGTPRPARGVRGAAGGPASRAPRSVGPARPGAAWRRLRGRGWRGARRRASWRGPSGPALSAPGRVRVVAGARRAQPKGCGRSGAIAGLAWPRGPATPG
jgi:hypothetical protein